MALQKTVTRPTGDPAPILDSTKIKVVVIDNRNNIVAIADNLALNPPTAIDRYVVWFKDRTDPMIAQRFPAIAADPAVIAFSVSTTGKVADIIKGNDPIDYVRVAHAYTKAGLPINN